MCKTYWQDMDSCEGITLDVDSRHVDKPAHLIIRFIFEFASDSVFVFVFVKKARGEWVGDDHLERGHRRPVHVLALCERL